MKFLKHASPGTFGRVTIMFVMAELQKAHTVRFILEANDTDRF